MSKSGKFDDVLDECLERLLVKNETVEQCLESFPEHSDELKPLLETALATRKMSAIQPRTKFRERARHQFALALQEVGRKKSHPFFSLGWQPRWATAAAIVLVLSLAGGGTVAAASGSMPDSPLYTVKMATEQVELALTFSELGKAELHARLADKRVTEIIYLADKDKPEKIARTTERLNTQLAEITVLVSTPEVVSGIAMAPTPEQVPTALEAATPAPAPTLRQATATEEVPAPAQTPTVQITPTAQKVPAPKQATVAAEAPTTKQTTASNETRISSQATTAKTVPVTPQATAVEIAPGAKLQEEQAGKVTALPGEGEKGGKEASPNINRRAKLKTTVESQANNNIARLRAQLATASASAKPALQRALDLSEAEYEKAIEALK